MLLKEKADGKRYSIIKVNADGKVEYFKSTIETYNEITDERNLSYVFWDEAPSFRMENLEYAERLCDDIKGFYKKSNCSICVVELVSHIYSTEVVKW
jgi:hypothetical protein